MKSKHEMKIGKELFDYTAFRSEGLKGGMLSGMVGLVNLFYR